MTTRKEFADQEREWLNRFNDAYREGIRNLSDPDYVRGLLRGIEEKLADIILYNPAEGEPHVAVYIIGQVKARIEKILTDTNFIDEYEQRRDELNAFLSDVEPDGDESHSDQLEASDEL